MFIAPSPAEGVTKSSHVSRSEDPWSVVSRWALRVGAFGLPVAFLPSVADEFVLPKLLLLRLLVLALALLMVIRSLRAGEVTWKRTPLDLPLLAFIASASLSTIFAINRNVAIFGAYNRYEGLLTIVSYALLFWLSVQLITGSEEARALIWTLLFSAYVVSVVALLQPAFGFFGGGYFQTETGATRADSTLANPDFLGIFLAMVLPIAFSKVASMRPLLTRVLSANVLVVIGLALLVSFTRAAWIGAVIGVFVVLALRRGRFHPTPLFIGAGILIVGLTIVIISGSGALGRPGNGSSVLKAFYSRLVSIPDLGSGQEALRISVWRDTLPLIGSRPLAGYGPDTFGLVYPSFQTANRNLTLWDKPHEDLLQAGATQGLPGMIAYVWILAAFVRAFWHGRRLHGAVALFGGWVGYQVANQVNFSYIPTAAPFWMLSAAATATWAAVGKPITVAAFPKRAAVPVLAASALVLAAMSVPVIGMAYLADANYYSAQGASDAGQLEQARGLIGQARSLNPSQSVYAAQAGDFALNLDANGQPSSNADWGAAKEAYEAASRLGTDSPEVFRHLAAVDLHFGDRSGATLAARRALNLDRYDPASQALVRELAGG